MSSLSQTSAPPAPTPVDTDTLDANIRPQAWVEIDLGAVRRNFARVCSELDSTARVIVSVKKDAYGHGLTQVVQQLQSHDRIAGFGVATLEEGIELRRSGFDGSILIFSVLSGAELRSAIDHEIDLTVTCADEAREATSIACEMGLYAHLHWKVDAGMGGFGLSPEDSLLELDEISGELEFELQAIYAHFPSPNLTEMKDRWSEVDCLRSEAGFSNINVHLGGSDALALGKMGPGVHFRSGIAVFGCHDGIDNLEPAMAMKSRVVYRRRANAGTKISYDGTFALKRDSELAIIGVGYGNGYPRALSNIGSVMIGSARCPILGRVCMDQTIIDVTDSPNIEVGEEALLFGGRGSHSAQEVAAQAGTVAYELMCNAGQQNPRFFRE